ncbi:MAG: T9SS type A sorting domain-containing protein [Candidatus Limimorpha sp.]
MRKTIFTLLLGLLTLTSQAQQPVEKTIVWDGLDRHYLEYVPTTYTAGDSAPVMFYLHGMGDHAADAFNAINPIDFAEAKGWIMVFPQAVDWTYSLPMNLGNFPMGPSWNAGIHVDAAVSYLGNPYVLSVDVNPDVDDSGFLVKALQTVEQEYDIDTDSIFFCGFSLGGFMSHRMAIEHGDVINSIAAVSGNIANTMSTLTPVANVNVLQIHGTADTVVSYDSASVSYGQYGPYNVGLGAEASTEYWRAFNHCDPQAVVEFYPDTHPDGLTFEMHSFLNGDNNSRVALLKVNNGGHYWYNGENNDIDYLTEIYRFFTNTLDVTGTAENGEKGLLTVYPNPAADFIVLPLEEPAEVRIFDLTGSEVLHEHTHGRIDVSQLPNGFYFLNTATVHNYRARFVISH